MRKVTHIVVHCTGTSLKAKVEAILNYWRTKLKWRNPGYHRIVAADGVITKLAGFNKITNGVKWHNSTSIHISYIGGIDKKGKAKDTRTNAQKIGILTCIAEALRYAPDAKIVGHRDFKGVTKACPSFDAINEYKNI